MSRSEASADRSYGVLLNAASSSKIETIRVVRESAGVGLKEAKLLVEAAPVAIVDGIDRDAAAAIVQNLLDIGARPELALQDSAALIAGRQVAAHVRAQAASGCLVMLAVVLLAVTLAGVLPA